MTKVSNLINSVLPNSTGACTLFLLLRRLSAEETMSTRPTHDLWCNCNWTDRVSPQSTLILWDHRSTATSDTLASSSPQRQKSWGKKGDRYVIITVTSGAGYWKQTVTASRRHPLWPFRVTQLLRPARSPRSPCGPQNHFFLKNIPIFS